MTRIGPRSVRNFGFVRSIGADGADPTEVVRIPEVVHPPEASGCAGTRRMHGMSPMFRVEGRRFDRGRSKSDCGSDAQRISDAQCD